MEWACAGGGAGLGLGLGSGSTCVGLIGQSMSLIGTLLNMQLYCPWFFTTCLCALINERACVRACVHTCVSPGLNMDI